MKQFRFLTVVTILLLLMTVTRSQQPQAPDSKEILRQAVAACLKVKTVEYLSVQETLAASRMMFPNVTMQMRRERADVPGVFMPGRFYAAGKSSFNGQEKEFEYAYDGRVFRHLNKAANEVNVMKDPTPDGVGQFLAHLGLGIYSFVEFTSATPLDEFMETPGELVYAGVADVDGIACHVIKKTLVRKVETGRGALEISQSTTVYIGEKDLLPRRYLHEINTGNRTTRSQQTAFKLRVNAPFDETAFWIQPGADYVEKLMSESDVVSEGLLLSGSTAPEWKVSDSAGQMHELADYKGRIIVLDFWATWCSPCLKAMPYIQKLHENFAKRGVVVLGMATQDDAKLAAAYMKQKGYTYPLLLNGESLKQYNPTRLPTLYIIGPDSKVVYGETGNRTDGYEKLAGILERQLKLMGQ